MAFCTNIDRLVVASVCLPGQAGWVDKLHQWKTEALLGAINWHRARSCVVKPLHAHQSLLRTLRLLVDHRDILRQRLPPHHHAPLAGSAWQLLRTLLDTLPAATRPEPSGAANAAPDQLLNPVRLPPLEQIRQFPLLGLGHRLLGGPDPIAAPEGRVCKLGCGLVARLDCDLEHHARGGDAVGGINRRRPARLGGSAAEFGLCLPSVSVLAGRVDIQRPGFG